jgi:hypothetical protein
MLTGDSVQSHLRALGTVIVHQRYICTLKVLTCSWREMSSSEFDALQLPDVYSGHSRIQLRTETAMLQVSRHAMVRLGTHTPSLVSEMTGIDCKEFTQWMIASQACEALRTEIAPGEYREHWTFVLSLPKLNPMTDYFHFLQVDVPMIKHGQADVHGLLGQRVVEAPASTSVAHQRQRPSAGTAALDEEHADVDLIRSARARFGHQGGGAIEGHYTDYMVTSLMDHHFPYSTFDLDVRA